MINTNASQGSPQTVEQRRCATITPGQRHYTHFQCQLLYSGCLWAAAVLSQRSARRASVRPPVDGEEPPADGDERPSPPPRTDGAPTLKISGENPANAHKDRITTQRHRWFFFVKLFIFLSFSGKIISIINKISVKYCLFFHFNTEICSPQLLVLAALDLFK